MNVVVFCDRRNDSGVALYLKDVKRDGCGRIKSGTVINGAWKLMVEGDEMLACDVIDSTAVVNRWKVEWEHYVEVEVSKDISRKNYNDVIEWARQQVIGNCGWV